VAPEPPPDPPAGRPTVWLNCAASMDGRLAFAEGARAPLSGPEDLARVQRLRADVDGILVGVGTVLLDDPSLRVHWELLGRTPGPAPYRIVLDGSGRTPQGARFLDGSLPTIVATTRRCTRSFPPSVRTLVVGEDRVDLVRLFAELRRLGLRRLMIEGGASVFASVLRADLFDRWTVYYAPVVIGGRTAPALVAGPEAHGFDEAVRLELAGVERLGEGFVATYLPRPRPPGR